MVAQRTRTERQLDPKCVTAATLAPRNGRGRMEVGVALFILDFAGDEAAKEKLITPLIFSVE